MNVVEHVGGDGGDGSRSHIGPSVQRERERGGGESASIASSFDSDILFAKNNIFTREQINTNACAFASNNVAFAHIKPKTAKTKRYEKNGKRKVLGESP